MNFFGILTFRTRPSNLNSTFFLTFLITSLISCGLVDKKISGSEKPAEPFQTDTNQKKSKIEIKPIKSETEIDAKKNDNLKPTEVISSKSDSNSENKNDLNSKVIGLPAPIESLSQAPIEKSLTTIPVDQPNKPENLNSINRKAMAIIGAWQSSPTCYNFQGSKVAQKEIFTFDKVRFSYDVTVYDAPDCTVNNRSHQQVESGTWSEDNGVIKFIVDSFQQSDSHPNTIDRWNARKECGRGDWEVNKLVETVGVICGQLWKTQVGDLYKASYTVNADKLLLTLNGRFVDQVTGVHDSLNFIYPYELEPLVK